MNCLICNVLWKTDLCPSCNRDTGIKDVQLWANALSAAQRRIQCLQPLKPSQYELPHLASATIREIIAHYVATKMNGHPVKSSELYQFVTDVRPGVRRSSLRTELNLACKSGALTSCGRGRHATIKKL